MKLYLVIILLEFLLGRDTLYRKLNLGIIEIMHARYEVSCFLFSVKSTRYLKSYWFRSKYMKSLLRSRDGDGLDWPIPYPPHN